MRTHYRLDQFMSPITNDKKHVAFFDILGFSNIVKNYSSTSLSGAIKSLFFPIMDRIRELYGITALIAKNKIKLIHGSDSIILYTDDDSEFSFELLMFACNQFMFESFKIGFPLRGAISHGEFIHEETQGYTHFLGSGLVEAVEWEKEQNWAGCVLTTSSLNIVDQYTREPSITSEYGIMYDVPFKVKRVKHYALSKWASFFEVPMTAADYFMPSESEDVQIKIKNTQDFINFVLWESQNVLGM